jgi:hypothetical protein
MLTLLEQVGPHSGYNYHDVIGNIIAEYNLSSRISWFVMDNAYNNDTCINFLVAELGFNKEQRRVRYATHIFNLVA